MKIAALLFALFASSAQAVMIVNQTTVDPNTLRLETSFEFDAPSAQTFSGAWDSGTFKLDFLITETVQPLMVISLSTFWNDGWIASNYYNIFFNWGGARTYAAPGDNEHDYYFYKPPAIYATQGSFFGVIFTDPQKSCDGDFTFSMSRVTPRPPEPTPVFLPDSGSTLLLFGLAALACFIARWPCRFCCF